jgi:UDP-N-acetylmuramate: L-alanyl-gamma-D-glutamyl-meso-diaminopimelate ligase
MHIHILGICGTFMGGIAVLAKQSGHTVTGCDANVYPPMSTQLEEQGITLHQGYDAEQLDRFKADLYVVGNVMTRGKPVIEEILNRGLRYVSGPQWLAEHVLHDKHVLAVAGTHGKTTTSSMLAWILAYAGKNPGFLVGGIPFNFHVSALYTDSKYFVVEADEYDTAFFDKRSKFVHYRPRTAVLNNLEFDHADIFPEIGAIETQFHHLVRIVPGAGKVVANGDEASLGRVLERGLWTGCERFGTKANSDWQTSGSNDQHFTVLYHGQTIGDIKWQLTGVHNRLNALAAIAAAHSVGVQPAQAIEALAHFKNVKRRLELIGEARGVKVYDDFAHHPTAIETTIAGLRNIIKPGERIVAVLEPRSNTMKAGVMKAQLPKSLADADLVFAYAKDLGWDVGAALQPLSTKAAVYQDIDTLVTVLGHVCHPGDHVLMMSNGGFGGIHKKLVKHLGESQPAG